MAAVSEVLDMLYAEDWAEADARLDDVSGAVSALSEYLVQPEGQEDDG